MITERGTLIVGIEKDGKVHKDFEVRPALVEDAIAVAGEHTPAQLSNEVFYGVCLAAKQVVRIGEISPVTSGDLRRMVDIDFKEISKARERLEKQLRSFRGGDDDKQDAATGSPPANKAVQKAPPGASEATVSDGKSA